MFRWDVIRDGLALLGGFDVFDKWACADEADDHFHGGVGDFSMHCAG